ncbi:ABC-2 type transporter [Clostridium aceticum]|uniref:ABC-2 type transporter n=1 Tax=Clostridium aceticum TaxID=84022 RepID=A0A0D8I6I6_9CLOT|nr:ABC transporter permease [Clostridium aceticum]AKL95762.1 ABC-2 type transporter [Clostridium aceticum]KJF25689.1 hypothetical protein TZ02_17485 [Clostridium aceticum]
MYSYEPILETILNENPKFQMTSRQIGDKQPILYGIMSMVIVMLAIFFGGTVSGFNIVAEKDTKTIRSMSVSPLKMSGFVAARGVVAILISIIIGLLSSLILAGVTVNYYKILLMLLASSSMTVIIALLIGRIANNQISSIATIKVIMPVFIALPLVSLFIPKSWQLLLYPLPNYWAFMSLYHIFLGEGSSTWFFASISALFLTGTIYLLVLSKTFKNHFSLR